MTLTPERIADMREALDADPDLDSVTSRRTTFLALLDAADQLAQLRAILERVRPMFAKKTPRGAEWGQRYEATVDAIAEMLRVTGGQP